MHIRKVYARFYRSLNFDYLARDAGAVGERPPWESIPDGRWYPHVFVRIEPSITTVVGANEAGKTQVIDAIRAGLSGEGISQSDFCRHSDLFAVDAPVAFPEFGIEVGRLSVAESAEVNGRLQLRESVELTATSSLWVFRTPTRSAPEAGCVYWRDPEAEGGYGRLPVDDLSEWTDLLPTPWKIDATIALPDSVPIQWLIDQKPSSATSRRDRLSLVNSVLANHSWFTSEASIQQNSAAIAEQLNRPGRVDAGTLAQFDVARQLLVNVAGIDPVTFEELSDAAERSDEGYAVAVATAMNDLIRRNLNPAHWWTQDPEFSLTVGLRDHDLIFTIRDRTGKDYTFGERSTGLRYFLSYLVQFLAARPRAGSEQRILLMDEPDTYLSSAGQQDLLRILTTAAFPDDPSFEATQVVYVTHSPFLIDRNHSERVRLLDKGDLDEGTRVVDKAHHNRYEPLRTSLGPMVGETTFVGSRNIIVEGPSDQILIAGLAVDLRRHGLDGRKQPPSELLDLNEVTIVPAGGTPHIPFMTYLARGRGETKPPVVVLVDSDAAGADARQELSALSVDGTPVIPDDLVVEISSVGPAGGSAETIEDLIPDSVATLAVDVYHDQLGQERPQLNEAEISDLPGGLLDRLNQALAARTTPHLSLQKVAFARCVLDSLEFASPDQREEMRRAFAPLVSRLAQAGQLASDRERAGAIRKSMRRATRAYAADYNPSSSREHAARLLNTLDSLIDVGPNFEPVRAKVSEVRSQFALHADLGDPFAEHEAFVEAARQLPNYLRTNPAGSSTGAAADTNLANAHQQLGVAEPQTDTHSVRHDEVPPATLRPEDSAD